jgi:predicted transcriptional regulator
VYAAPVNLTGWDWLIAARPFVLSAVLPILVVYLSEIAASDVNYAVQQAERERRKERQKMSISEEMNTFPMPVEQAQRLAAEQAQRSKTEALDVIVSHLDTHPAASLSEIGQLVGRARSTVGNYLDELETAGRIRKNGNGWEVAE